MWHVANNHFTVVKVVAMEQTVHSKNKVVLRRLRLLNTLKKRAHSRIRKTRQNLPIFRITWDAHVAQLRGDDEFKRRYRMPKETFNFLLAACARCDDFFKPLSITAQKRTMSAYKCSGIEPEHKLGAALRWFAGGSYLDIRLCHGMSVETMYECVWRAVDAINAADVLALKFPWNDEKKLQQIELGFAKLTGGKLRDYLFAVDGFCIRITAPRGIPNVQDYRHRKGFYAIVVQACVDSTGKFIAASFNATGGTHDSLAFKMSAFWDRLESGDLCRRVGLGGLESYYGVGDDAYENREFLVTPWPGRNLPFQRDAFNYFQSRCRIVVECAFGRLTTRWGCLWRTLSVSHKKVPRLVSALMKLHNLCDDLNVIRIAKADLEHFMRNGQAPLVFTNDGPLDPRELKAFRVRRRVESSQVARNHTRQAVTEMIRQLGGTRPPHSRYRC